MSIDEINLLYAKISGVLGLKCDNNLFGDTPTEHVIFNLFLISFFVVV